MLYKSVLELIGNTPLIEIDKKITGLKNIRLFAKCELYNPFGSVKDRTAYGMYNDNKENIKDKILVEISSGNTAKALDIIAGMDGNDFISVTNRIKIPEIKDILKTIGAKIIELPGTSECPIPDDPSDAFKYIENMMLKEPNKYYHLNQYENKSNINAHRVTGKEIFDDIGAIDYYFGGLGTTGSSRGIIEYHLEKNPNLKKIGVIASKDYVLPGIRNIDEMHEVGIFKKELYDDIITVEAKESIDTMLTLHKKMGILAGPTTGGALCGALKYLREVDKYAKEGEKAVFIACDRFEHYMSYIKKIVPELYGEENKESIRTLTKEDLNFAKHIEVENVLEFIEKNKPLIIDMRGNLAFQNGFISGSMNILDIDFEEMITRTKIPFSTKNKILLVCPTGDKSEKCSALLNKRGMDTYSLKDGIIAYKEKELPLEKIVLKEDEGEEWF